MQGASQRHKHWIFSSLDALLQTGLP